MKKAITFLFSLTCTLFSANAAEHTVTISNNVFSPGNLTIAPGDVVKWVLSAGAHSVTSNTGAWPEAILSTPGAEFSHTFATAGTFPYHCIFHTGMNGTVVVSGTNAAPGTMAAPLVLKTFPNPAHNQLFVSASLKSAGQLEIRNMLGQPLQTQTLYPATAETYLVNLKNLPAGAYLIILRQEDAILSKNTFLKAD